MKGSREHEDNEKNTLECSTLHPPATQTGMHMCERTRVHRERPFERILSGVVSILHLCPIKAQLQKQEATVCCETSYLHLIIVLFFFSSASKVSTSTGGEGWASLAGHPLLPHPPSLLLCPISCWSTSSLRSPPTTR